MHDVTTADDHTAQRARGELVKRGLSLTWLTLLYNLGEASLSLTAAVVAGSVALMAFGVDSTIEMLASVAALWRLYSDADPARREHSERVALRIIGFSFLALAAYVGYQSIKVLWAAAAPPQGSLLGIVVAGAAVIVMPILARAKTRVALAMRSGALHAEAKQTMLCTYLSAILLGGLILNATLGWWWADPLAALAMAPIIAREGWNAFRGRQCACCAG